MFLSKKYRVLKLLFLIAFLYNGLFVFGQNTGITNQIWLDFNPSFELSEKLEYSGDLGYRTDLVASKWSEIHLNPSIKYTLNQTIQSEAGIGLFFVFSEQLSRFEITPFQSVSIIWPRFNNVKFKNILKVEERFSYLTSNWKPSFDIRLRYKLESRIKFENSLELKKFSIPLYLEFFIPVNNNIDEIFSNKFRFGSGIAYKPIKNYEVTFYYNWEKSRVNLYEDFSLAKNAFQIKLKKIFQ